MPLALVLLTALAHPAGLCALRAMAHATGRPVCASIRGTGLMGLLMRPSRGKCPRGSENRHTGSAPPDRFGGVGSTAAVGRPLHWLGG